MLHQSQAKPRNSRVSLCSTPRYPSLFLSLFLSIDLISKEREKPTTLQYNQFLSKKAKGQNLWVFSIIFLTEKEKAKGEIGHGFPLEPFAAGCQNLVSNICWVFR